MLEEDLMRKYGMENFPLASKAIFESSVKVASAFEDDGMFLDTVEDLYKRMAEAVVN